MGQDADKKSIKKTTKVTQPGKKTPSENCRYCNPKRQILCAVLSILAIIAFALSIRNTVLEWAHQHQNLQHNTQIQTLLTKYQTHQKILDDQDQLLQAHSEQLGKLSEHISAPNMLAHYAALQYLVSLADSALTIAHDPNGALMILTHAQAQMRDWSPAPSAALNAAISSSIRMLQKIHQANPAETLTKLSKIAHQLEIRGHIKSKTVQMPKHPPTQASAISKPQSTDGWNHFRNFLSKAKRSLKDAVSISHSGTQTNVDIFSNSAAGNPVCVQQMLLGLGSASLAVTLQDDQLYQNSLGTVSSWLDHCPSAAARGELHALQAQIQSLRQHKLAIQLPKLSSLHIAIQSSWHKVALNEARQAVNKPIELKQPKKTTQKLSRNALMPMHQTRHASPIV